MEPRQSRPKLVVLQTHPIQYQAPLFRALAGQGRVALKVLYLSDAGARAHYDPGFARSVQWDVPLLEGYDYTVFRPGSSTTDSTFITRYAPGLFEALAREKPDWILVFGHGSLQNWLAAHWAQRHAARVLHFSDSNIRIVTRDWKFRAKRLVLPSFYRNVDLFLSPSEANREYLATFGADVERIRFVPFAIDAEPFLRMPSTAEVDFVWAAKLIDLKRPQDFVEALAALCERGHRPRASIVGDGPLVDRIRKLAASKLPDETLEFRGFVNQSKIPQELARGRVFVFTSERDAYGLAVTEAAATGLAIIAADVNGCVGANSIAQPGKNALTYRARDTAGLVLAMERYLLEPEMLARHQAESRAIAAGHDAKVVAERVADLVCAS